MTCVNVDVAEVLSERNAVIHLSLTLPLEPTLGLSELIPGLYISYSFLLMLFRVWAAFSQLGQLGESQIELRRFTGAQNPQS